MPFLPRDAGGWARWRGSGERADPGCPRQFDREEALASLAMRFWEKGYAGTSHEDMRQRTGLSGSSLRNSFRNKQAIFSASLERYRKMASPPALGLSEGSAGLDGIRAFITPASSAASPTRAFPPAA